MDTGNRGRKPSDALWVPPQLRAKRCGTGGRGEPMAPGVHTRPPELPGSFAPVAMANPLAHPTFFALTRKPLTAHNANARTNLS